MKKLRQHQLDLKRIGADIATGKVSHKTIVAHVTPGGGKSIGGAVFARELLRAGSIKRVVWVCPRTSLARQAADGFRDPEFNPVASARRADNVPPLFRDTSLGCVAYTTTYQSIVARPELHLRELKPHKYLLILDEPHHLKLGKDNDETVSESEEDDGTWIEAIAPLYDNAAYTLLMTGTIERHDKKLIPFIDYEEDGDSFFPKKDVFYSRYDALIEEAIVPIDFMFHNGWARFEDDLGDHNIEIASASLKDVSKVIQTFLSKTDFRDNLLKKGMDHWIATRKKTNYPSRMIVICDRQEMARHVAKQISSNYKVSVALAISDDTDSGSIIRNFRLNQSGDVLVTVGMAYEGLDVPDCKHMIVLTGNRSIPWLEQAFARVTRVDYKAMAAGINYSNQKAYIFVPDDPKMKIVVDHLKDEQDRGIRFRQSRITTDENVLEDDTEDDEDLDNEHGARLFRPIGATVTGSSVGELTIKEMDGGVIEKEAPVALPQDERDKRKRIEMMARRRDAMRRLPKGSTNKLLLSVFGKSRSSMSSSELDKVILYMDGVNRRGK